MRSVHRLDRPPALVDWETGRRRRVLLFWAVLLYAVKAAAVVYLWVWLWARATS